MLLRPGPGRPRAMDQRSSCSASARFKAHDGACLPGAAQRMLASVLDSIHGRDWPAGAVLSARSRLMPFMPTSIPCSPRCRLHKRWQR